MKNLVVDVDAGTDDAVALLILLTHEPESSYRVVAITCCFGNATLDQVCRNVLGTLQTVNRLDIPVYGGAKGPLLELDDFPPKLLTFHGSDGFGDAGLPPPKGSVQKEHAVQALYRIAQESRDGLDLLCLGPLTNLALCIRMYPKFSSMLSNVHIMGGNIKGVGNATSAAEFNFMNDPEAAHIVISSLKNITLFPWECCMDFGLSLEDRFEEIGKTSTAQIKFLNAIEWNCFKNEPKWTSVDSIVAAAYVNPSLIQKSEMINFSVELHGLRTRGQGLVDHCKAREPNVKVVEEMNFKIYRSVIVKMSLFNTK